MYDGRDMELQKTAWDHIDEIAAEIGVTPENLRKWHERGGIPPRWHARITRKLADRQILVDLDFFDSLAPPNRPKRAPGRAKKALQAAAE